MVIQKRYLLIFAIFHITIAHTDVLKRTVNNGALILEEIPDIPEELVSSMNQYQNIRSASFRTFSHDGKSIFVTTRFGDIVQIHRVDVSGGARHQITFLSEPFRFESRNPKSDLIAFTMDAGGNEYSQIFILNPNTGNIKMVTDGESRNGQVEWSNDGNSIAFTSTRRNGASNDIWMLDLERPDSPKMVVQVDDGTWWQAVDWSDDGRKLLVEQYISVSNSRLYIVDVETQKKTLVAGSLDKDEVNYGEGFDLTGKGIFYITNQFSNFDTLAFKDLTTGKVTPITKDIPWDISGFSLSHNGKRAAFRANEGGYYSLYLLDVHSLNYQKVKVVPPGFSANYQFNADDSKLGMTINDGKSPNDAFILKLKDKPTDYDEIKRWTFSELGGLKYSDFIKPQLFSYKSFDGLDVPAFIYKPEVRSGNKLPVIIEIHGGPEDQSIAYFDSMYQLWLKRLGAAVITPNVRGSDGYGKQYINLDNGFNREDAVKDIGSLLDWIESQPDLDRSRVAVIGGSYGGYMALATAVHYSDRIKAVVNIVGISNFVTFLESTKEYRRDLRRVEYGDERDPRMREFLQHISPVNNVEKIDVPLFVVQGQNDPRVPVTESTQIVKALRDRKKTVWYMNALNEGHGYRKKDNLDIYNQAIVLFFEKYLL